MNNIFISYIIPCYNIQSYLQTCFNSLVKQRVCDNIDVEFIFVNDGSTDNTLSILKEFKLKDSRVTVLDQPNQGVSSARNNGLKYAKGDYVFFLDSDDSLTDDTSLLMYKLYNEYKPDIIVANAFFVNEISGEKKEWNVCTNLFARIYQTNDFVDQVNALPISFKFYRRDIIIQNGILYDEELKVGEVYVFFLHCLAYSKTIAFTENYIMNYLVRSGSVMRDFNVKRDSLISNTIIKIDYCASLFEFNIKNKLSYNKSFYDIVGMFSFGKYYSGPFWSNEIVDFLESIRKTKIYKDVLKYLMRNHGGFNRKTISLAILCYLPVRLSYILQRIKKVL